MSTAQTTAPLWQQLQASARVLAQIRQGQSATAVLAAIAADQRAGVQALSFAVLRDLGRAQALRKALAPKKPNEAVDALLCTALALLCPSSAAAYEAHTLVNQAVEAAKNDRSTRAQAPFINACLRRFLRERERLMAHTDTDAQALWNHPPWWISRLKQDWPSQWQRVLTAAQSPGPLTLRVNRRKTTQKAYLALLGELGLQASAVGSSGVRLDKPVPVMQLPHFAQGWVSVQDAAAQLAAPLLLSALAKPQGARVLDACAAPGGKTAHLLELADLDLLALDVDATRCERIHDTFKRLGLNAQVLAADAEQVALWWDGRLFDAVLLDAPCSASGIVRRHPDIRWLRRASDIDALAALQQRLMQALWPLLSPGGVMLYCTCSVFKAEGENQLKTFLVNNTDATLLPSPGHLLPAHAEPVVSLGDNAHRDQDGFYYALLRKAVQ